MCDSSQNEYKLTEEQIKKQEYFNNLYRTYSPETNYAIGNDNKKRIDLLWDLFRKMIKLIKDDDNLDDENLNNAFDLYVGDIKDKIEKMISDYDNEDKEILRDLLEKNKPLPRLIAQYGNYYVGIGQFYLIDQKKYGIVKKDDEYQIGNETKTKNYALNCFKNGLVKFVKKFTTIKKTSDNTSIGAKIDSTIKEFKDKEGFPAINLYRYMVILESMRADDCDYFNCFPTTVDDGAVERLASACKVNIEGKSFFKDGENINKAEMKILDLDTEKLKDDKEFHKFKAFSWDKLAKDEWYKNLKIKPGSFTNMNIILHGAPGTGKTFSVAREIDHCRIIDNDKYGRLEPVFIQFHPSYTYQDFIEGIKPAGIVGGSLDLKPMNGSFKQFCIDVKKENEKYFKELKQKEKKKQENTGKDDKEITEELRKRYNKDNPKNFEDWPHYFFVVDEINRGNLSSIFGETFTLLEYRDYDFSGVYDKKGPELVETVLSNLIKAGNDSDLIYKEIGGKVLFGIPFNIHFIGMMNDVDRSIDSFDLALRRRFSWEELRCDYDVIENSLKADQFFKKDFRKSCERLNKYITETKKLGKKYEIGHAFFLKIKDIAETDKDDNLRISVKNKESLFDERIAGTLREYFSYNSNNGETEVEKSVEDAKKIFAKTETDYGKIKDKLSKSNLYDDKEDKFIDNYVEWTKALNNAINSQADQVKEIEAEYFINALVKTDADDKKKKESTLENYKKNMKFDVEAMENICKIEYVCDDAGKTGSIEKRIKQWLELWNKDDKTVQCIRAAQIAFLEKQEAKDKKSIDNHDNPIVK